jgi:hypothetical protein
MAPVRSIIRLLPQVGCDIIPGMMSHKIAVSVAAVLTTALFLQPQVHAEQWAYAMQTGHGHHSIQVDVDSLTQRTDYVMARLLYEYFADPVAPAAAAGGAPPRSALVDGAFDCKGKRFQVLSRTEYSAAEGKGVAGTTTRSALGPERWTAASADPETFAIVDWVCSVAAHRLSEGQAGSMP